MKKIILSLTLTLCVTLSFAQAMQDVVYLKNGSIIHGTITQLVPNEKVTISTADGSMFVYDMDEVDKITKEQAVAQPGASRKNPAVAGLLSFLVPGSGQLYNGDTNLGIVDICEGVGAFCVYELGGNMLLRHYDENSTIQDTKAVLGSWMVIGGMIWYIANDICSIVNAVKGAKIVNQENGYAMYDLGKGVSVGCRPNIGYERPQYACNMPCSFNSGMSFRIAF